MLATERMLEQAFDAHEAGDLEGAISSYLRVVADDPENVGALAALALVHSERREFDLAERLARRSLAIHPTVPAACVLGTVLLGRRQYDEAVIAFRVATTNVESELAPAAWANLLFALDLHPEASPALRKAERRAFDERYGRALTAAAPAHQNDPDPDRLLRVGYVTADVQRHSAAHAWAPVLVGHNPDRVRTYLYDVTTESPSPGDLVGPWIRGQAQVSTVVGELSDAQLAQVIRADQIDVLVDLSGYSAGGRPLLFARRPAPVQLSGLGYASGLGLSAMDGLLCDPVAVPDKHRDQYDEPLVYLPSLIPFDPAPSLTAERPWPEVETNWKATGPVTFGYLGRAIKLSQGTLGAWAEILLRCPDAQLVLKSADYDDQTLVRGIQSTLFALGVDPSRLRFLGGTSRDEHLGAYQQIDIALDSFPHNGGVTTLEALLMGVPVVAMAGGSICGRVSASILTTLGLADEIAPTVQAYVDRALALARSPLTSGQRHGLRTRLLDSILVDHERYTQAVEAAYRAAYARWARGESRTGRGD